MTEILPLTGISTLVHDEVGSEVVQRALENWIDECDSITH